jgi:hypothetical protein
MKSGGTPAFFTDTDEETVRRFFRVNRIQGSRSFLYLYHNPHGLPDTLRLTITLKPPLPEWVTRFANPPPRAWAAINRDLHAMARSLRRRR